MVFVGFQIRGSTGRFFPCVQTVFRDFKDISVKLADGIATVLVERLNSTSRQDVNPEDPLSVVSRDFSHTTHLSTYLLVLSTLVVSVF